MEKCVEKLLTGLGYKVNNKPYEYIKECNEWYENKPQKTFTIERPFKENPTKLKEQDLQKEDVKTMLIFVNF